MALMRKLVAAMAGDPRFDLRLLHVAEAMAVMEEVSSPRSLAVP